MNEFESEPCAGAAPAERTCRYTKADGQPCRAWAIRGQDYCHRHGIFIRARVERPIDVPLLEDEASIILLLSETMRALAWGTLPIANGRMLLDGCRFAWSIHNQHLEMGKFRLKLRRMGIPEHEIFDSQQPAISTAAAPQQQADPEPGARCPEPDINEEPLTTPLMEPPDQRYHCFRDLKTDWDKDLLKMGNEMGDMVSRRYKETREEFKAARARPFDHLAEIDREVERARALGKAHDEALAQAEAASQPC